MSYSQEECFKISVIAKVLHTSKQTVWRLIKSGAIQGEKKGNAWVITRSALRNYILGLIGKSGTLRLCETGDQEVSILENKAQQVPPLTRYLLQQDTEALIEGQVTAEQALPLLEKLLRKLAWRFGRRDSWLRDDLYQEMSYAILLCPGHNTLAFYASRAESRARDALRKEFRHGMVSVESLEHDDHPAVPDKPDCSAVIELFKFAGLGLSLLEEFNIHLFDEEGKDDHVLAEGRDCGDERDDGRSEDVHQGSVSGSSPTRAA